uniref:Emb2411 (Embryo defective 2411) n=1 Tax=Arundo donax TaxID=35708 RepID=A0A0A9DZ62_ARUDO
MVHEIRCRHPLHDDGLCNIGGKICEIDAFRISVASSLRRIISPIKSDLFTLMPNVWSVWR